MSDKNEVIPGRGIRLEDEPCKFKPGDKVRMKDGTGCEMVVRYIHLHMPEPCMNNAICDELHGLKMQRVPRIIADLELVPLSEG